jgi:hypothetical protein
MYSGASLSYVPIDAVCGREDSYGKEDLGSLRVEDHCKFTESVLLHQDALCKRPRTPETLKGGFKNCMNKEIESSGDLHTDGAAGRIGMAVVAFSGLLTRLDIFSRMTRARFGSRGDCSTVIQ